MSDCRICSETPHVVNTTSDVIVENAGEGTDLVRSSVAWTLATTALANVENLTLIAAAAINGTGNDLANVITGTTRPIP